MAIYIVLFCWICTSGYVFLIKFKNRRCFLFCSFFAMSLVIGLRGPTVGEDTQHYLEVFNNLATVTWPTIFTSGLHVVWDPMWKQTVEILYAIINKTIACFTNNGQVLLFTVATITCSLFARFIYRNTPDNVFIATIFVLCDSFFMGAFNGIRHMLALAIVINAYEYLEKKEYKKVLLIVLTACLVHNSAIAIMALFVVLLIKDTQLGLVAVCFTCVLVTLGFPFFSQVVSSAFPRYGVYFTKNYWSPNSLRGTLILWAVELWISVYFLVTKIRNRQEYTGILGLVLYITVELLGQHVVAIGRLTYYFRFFTVMLFPNFAGRLKREVKVLFYLVLVTLFALEYLSYASTPTRAYSFCW